MNEFFDPVPLVALIIAFGTIPFMVVMITAFAKIVVVLFLLRQALGVQQTPPNLVMYGTALVLTIFLTAPLFHDVAQAIGSGNMQFSSLADVKTVFAKAETPIRTHVARFANGQEVSFFLDAASRIWPERMLENLSKDSLLLLIPSFVVSELTRAFEIGFMLYLPFVAIDLIVSNLLLAMGSMMVSPMMISLPLKLFLFVMVDGWGRLLHGLVLSYE